MTTTIEVPEYITDLFSDETLQWFYQSDLATDPTTATVVECLHTLRSAPGLTLADDVDFALSAAYFHRAQEVAGVDELAEIPGLSSMTQTIIYAYPSSAKLKKHCTYGEERVGAAILNMATRWAAGKKGYKWSFDVVQNFYGDASYVTAEVSLLEEIEGALLG